MSIKLKDYPGFIRYFFKYGDIGFEEAHKRFLNALSILFTSRYKYQELINDEALLKTRNYVAKLRRTENQIDDYPQLADLLNYVYTREEPTNPFAPWIEFSFYEPLSVFLYASEIHNSLQFNSAQLQKNERSTIQLKKFAKLIFALHFLPSVLNKKSAANTRELIETDILNPNNKEEILSAFSNYKGDAFVLEKPSLLNDWCGLDKDTINQYVNLIDVKLVTHRHNINGELKTRSWLFGADTLRTNVLRKTENINTEMGKVTIREIQSSGLDPYLEIKKDPILLKYFNNYQRLLYRNKEFFYLPTLGQNPLVRVSHSDQEYIFYSPSKVFHLEFALLSLYRTGSFKKLLNLPLQEIDEARKFIFNLKPQTIVEQLKEKFRQANLYKLPQPISSPMNPNSKGRHFDQIDKVSKIIQMISQNGIPVNKSILHKIRLEKEEELYVLESKDFSFDIVYDEKKKILDLISKQKIITNLKFIQSMLGSLSQRNTKRIYGYFTPHGANTHRTTCVNLRLQGIPKSLRKSFTPPAGRVLISVDISGQDITVAANLAYKLFSNTKMKALLDDGNFEENRIKTKSTLNKLKKTGNTANLYVPVDHITEKLKMEFNDEPFLRGWVKEYFYLIMYGGGSRAVGKKYKPSSNSSEVSIEPRLFSKEELNDFTIYSIGDSDFNNIDNTDGKFNNIEIMNVNSYRSSLYDIEELNSIPNFVDDYPFFFKAIQYISQNDSLAETARNIYAKVLDTILEEYPGIIESYDYYMKYTKEHNITFPTLLGWQTPVDDKILYGENLATRSKSYVIQASSAEFFREWIIQLNSRRHLGKFDIINIIHDEIVVEADSSREDKVIELMITSAKEAAKIVGIDPDTLHTSKPSIIK